MERLIILDYSTGEVDIYPVEYTQEPDMAELLESLGHREKDCNWMFADNTITFHNEILSKKNE